MYFVYKTTCLTNGKIYIGVHETSDLSDGYLGSGTYLRRAINKYGKENFVREIVEFCNSREEMLLREKEIVDEAFVSRKDTYNVTVGGKGSWYHVNNTLTEDQRKLGGRNGGCANKDKLSSESLVRMKEGWKKGGSVSLTKRWEEFRNGDREHNWKGRSHSEESRKKISEGKSKSLTGTVWIFNENLNVSKQIKQEDLQSFLIEGWIRGRKKSKNAQLA
jgi:hypothetical protein